MERCQSGRMGVPGKDVCWKRYQGFESLPLRNARAEYLHSRCSNEHLSVEEAKLRRDSKSLSISCGAESTRRARYEDCTEAVSFESLPLRKKVKVAESAKNGEGNAE